MRAHWPAATVRLVAQGTQFDDVRDGRANLTVTDDVEAALVAARWRGALCAGARRLTAEDKAWLLPRAADVAWTAYVRRWADERRAADAAALGGWLRRLGGVATAADACDTDATTTSSRAEPDAGGGR